LRLLYRGMTANSMPPTIETDRLMLKPHARADFEESVAMWADAGVTRHIGGKPFSREESWARLLRYAGLWALLGYGYWVVRDRRTGRFVGEVGFGNFHRELDPPFGDAPEAGWALATATQGRGFAGEALAAALAWGDAHLGDRTVCMIDPDNVPSLRVAARAGYREYARTTFKGSPTILFERLAGRNGLAK
jgi:RimJ/RimL family protein N-acetyltransferase